MTAELCVETGGPGLLIQDNGRTGHRREGLPASGAADPFRLAVGNTLLGNGDGDAALEITLGAGAVRYLGAPTRIVFAGGDFDYRLNHRRVAPFSVQALTEGDRVSWSSPKRDIRAYLCFAGGLHCSPQLGSCATHTRARLGGLSGNYLTAGDIIPVNSDPGDHTHLPSLSWHQRDRRRRLRIVPGPQADAFGEQALRALCQTVWHVDARSDRSGYRLQGPPLADASGGNIVSDPVLPGCIQVPASGLPLIIMPDGPTTGGYPKIATVISADLGLLSRQPPGAPVLFTWVSLEQALVARREQALWLERLAASHAATD